MTASDNSSTSLQAECERLTESLALAQRELQFVGIEVHDSVVQDLTAAAMLLEGAGQHATFPTPAAQHQYESGLRLLQQGIAAARKLVDGTSIAEVSETNLVLGLRGLVAKFHANHGLPVEFQCELQNVSLPTSVVHLLLRIAQESLYNAWKHAHASEVQLQLRKLEENLELVIADNGVGFEPAQVRAGRFGLEGMRARARILGASLVLDTAPNHGTRVVVQLPLVVM
jgi:signal transduction histidine kinase